MSDAYSYWLRALAITQGKRPLTREEMSGLGISEDEIGSGYYRMRAVPRGPFTEAIAIWEHEGELVATNNAGPVVPESVWLAACKFPITESEWQEHTFFGVFADEIKEETTT